MTFNDYIDELFYLRNHMIAPHVKKYGDMNGRQILEVIPKSLFNMFVKRVISVVIGGLYTFVVQVIESKLDKNKGKTEVVKVLEEILTEIGNEPQTAGIRFKQFQKDL